MTKAFDMSGNNPNNGKLMPLQVLCDRRKLLQCCFKFFSDL